MEFIKNRSGNTVASILIGVVVATVLIAVGAMVGMKLNENDDDTSSSSSSMMSSVSGGTTATPPAATSSSSTKTQADIDACINAATEAHNQRWASACADLRRSMEMAFNACMQNQQDEAYCTAQWGGYTSIDSTCDLGSAKTNSLNATFNVAKQHCM